MQLTRWNPFGELEEIQERLNRLFLEGRGPQSEATVFADWLPAVDIQETDGEFLVKADLPEVKKDDIKVQLESGVLTLEGERRKEKEDKGNRFHKIEREYGRFVRRFTLPTDIDAANVRAEFKEGVLNVHLPKSPAAKPRLLDVKVD